jgi:hypothetical protein
VGSFKDLRLVVHLKPVIAALEEKKLPATEISYIVKGWIF